MILIPLSLSSGAMYFVSKIKAFNIVGFDLIGIYSLFILVIVGVVFIFQVIKRLGSV